MDTDLQSEATRSFFQQRAPEWSAQYQDGGCMSDRVLRFLSPLEKLLPAGGRVLDLGCGTGEIAVALAGRGWRVTGCDLAAGMIQAAQGRPNANAIDWHVLAQPAALGLPFEEGTFDAVICSSVLEYVADIPGHFEQVARVLKPGGCFLATVPDMSHPVRMAEERKRFWTKFGWVMTLVALTPLGSTYEYLRLSINRWPLSDWVLLAGQAGLVGDVLHQHAHPLAMLKFHRKV